jgi:ATP-dependent RNA helicase DOB1
VPSSQFSGGIHLITDFTRFIQSEQATKLREEFQAPLRQMQEMARRIAKVSKESKLPIVEDEYVQSFKVELMDVVMQWCKGASFSDICKVSDLPFGSEQFLD